MVCFTPIQINMIYVVFWKMNLFWECILLIWIIPIIIIRPYTVIRLTTELKFNSKKFLIRTNLTAFIIFGITVDLAIWRSPHWRMLWVRIPRGITICVMHKNGSESWCYFVFVTCIAILACNWRICLNRHMS